MKTTIELAREAAGAEWYLFREFMPEIHKLAELIRADEREACAKVCDRVVEGKDPDDIHSDSQWAALTLAAEIRARSNT